MNVVWQDSVGCLRRIKVHNEHELLQRIAVHAKHALCCDARSVTSMAK